MEVLGYVFGIFGLLAYLEVSSLKKRVNELENALSTLKGTDYYEQKTSLLKAVQSYIGQKVTIQLKEDYEDPDIINYGNSKHGSITISEADEQWMLVSIESPKKNLEKLIRLEAVERISAHKE